MDGMTIGDLAEPPRKSTLKVTRPYRLRMRALDGDDKRLRNYMKALRRSMRNSRAGR